MAHIHHGQGTAGTGIYGAGKLLFYPHSSLVLSILPSLSARDDREAQGDDGSAAACLTEHSCPTATKLGVMVLQGVQQRCVHLGLRRDSHLTGYCGVFIPAEPEVFGWDQ